MTGVAMGKLNLPKSRRQIGIVATRLEGTDGVSLETKKWTDVLERLGYECFYLTGESDRADGHQHIIPEVQFTHPEIERIYTVAFSERSRPPEITRATHRMTEYLKRKIEEFVDGFGIDLLLLENALAIPLNLPLGLALTEFIAERSFPAIAHHHDFFWERKRFLVNCIWDYLNMAFPPHLPTIRHVVINSSASNQLSLRTGISGMIIPNVMDFDNPPPPPDAYTENLRADVGLDEWELFFLQPTRVVQRKGIEHAIELIHSLGFPARLVISHASGDEGHSYERRVRAFADQMNVRVSFLSDLIGPQRSLTPDGRRIYSLADVYPHADLVTYPSSIEGFGNAFLEAIYFRRPLLVNNYSIFAIDIKPKGFRVIEFDDFISPETVEQARRVLGDQELSSEMTEHNYALGRRHYSYAMLERRLETLLRDCFGEET
jgi:glycosyltransferase involved in cell wall biosynthesis